MNKIFTFLFSTRFTAILMVLFSVGMAVATFIENDFGTPAARRIVFDALWFEVVMGLLAVNFLGNIKKYRLWKRQSWPVLVFHLSLIVIIIGAGISRSIAFEGVMHIREGKESNTIISDKTYLQVYADEQYHEKQLTLTPITNNQFNWNIEAAGKDVDIKFVSYIPHAIQTYEQAENGTKVLHLVASGGPGGRNDIYIRAGDVVDVMGTSVSYNLTDFGDLRVFEMNGELMLSTDHDTPFMRMADQFKGVAYKDSINKFQLRSLYTTHSGVNFVASEIIDNAVLKIMPSDKEEDKNKEDVLVVNVEVDGINQDVMLNGMKGSINPLKEIQISGVSLLFRYGSKALRTPFSIQLNDFQLERYPGSQSPASFASEVTVINEDETFDFRIFMNNVLDYQGYRFFQSSYDSDELGTVLSVNHDRPGTYVTYFGYALMALAMLMTLFWKGTRFNSLSKQLGKNKGLVITLLLLGVGSLASAQHVSFKEPNVDSLLEKQTIDVEHAKNFGSLIAQDDGGRIKPLNTVSSEVLRKLYKRNTFNGMNADQVFLSMNVNPMLWSYVPIVRVTKGKHNVQDLLHVEGDHARYVDFFDRQGRYILAAATEEVSQKREADRNDRDKLLLEVSQRVTLLYAVLNGKMMRIFPMPNDPNNTWYSYTDYEAGFTAEDSTFVYRFPYAYFDDVRAAMASGDWTDANEKLTYFDKYQRHFGKEVFPSEAKVNLEIAYNRYEVFNELFKYYMFAGLIMLVFLISNIVNPKKWVGKMAAIMSFAIALMFLLHTAGLGVRWYISGHAPWSNAYESMVYVAWSTVLAGLFFIKRSPITLAATAIMAAMFLMVAHWNWMDPEIGNLVPVLNSYWLMIHVAIIVASYGPFTLAFLMGIIILFLYIMIGTGNKDKINSNIDQLSRITEMIITVGVFMLAIGTFLGGVWANESWGRYWSWDPKETWALISVMVYAFVLHMRLIPGLKGNYAFGLASILAYASIMMTYFGVNFYLAGMHSYAKGDPVPIPTFVYYTILGIALLAGLAYWRKARLEPKK